MHSRYESGAAGMTGTANVVVGRVDTPEPPVDIPEHLGHIEWSRWPAAVDYRGRVRWPVVLAHGLPNSSVPAEVSAWRWANRRNLARGVWNAARPRLGRGPLTGMLWCDVIRANGDHLPYGLVSFDRVVLAGVNMIVDAWQPATGVELENGRYHGIGQGTLFPTDADVQLVNEATTQTFPNSLRAAGSTIEAPSLSNMFRSVGTVTMDESFPMTEWGLFAAQTVGVPPLIDRAIFNVISLQAGDTVTWTFDLLFAPGG